MVVHGYKPVVRIGDHNRTGVFDYTKTLFGDEIEKTPIEVVRRGGSALTEAEGTVKDDRGGDVNQFSVDRERDTIWARGRVIRFEDDPLNQLKVKSAKRFVRMFIVV